MCADKLQLADVPVERRNFDGVTHEFFGTVDKAREAVQCAELTPPAGRREQRSRKA